MTTTPTPRPVPTTEDRMRDATTQPTQAPACSHGYTVYRDKHPNGQPCDDARTPRTFATYLDRTERDQLDARAATAEQERDEALDDRDILRAEIKRVEQTRQEQVQALNAKLQDALWTAGQHATTAASLRQQRDRTLADLTNAGNEVDQLTVDNARLRAELGAAQELIAVLDDVTEQLDRARAAYATTPGEPAEREDTPHEDPARLREQLAEAHADCARYATERDEARAERDNAKAVVEAAKAWAASEGIAEEDLAAAVAALPSALGSLPPRAQDDQPRVAPFGCDDCSVEHGQRHRYAGCPANLRQIERDAQRGRRAEREG